MRQLLEDAQREVVADVVNAALLASATGKPRWEVKPQVWLFELSLQSSRDRVWQLDLPVHAQE